MRCGAGDDWHSWPIPSAMDFAWCSSSDGVTMKSQRSRRVRVESRETMFDGAPCTEIVFIRERVR